ncbi:MAG TPA: acyl carrier protein, partial [Labilithrix sp.]
MSSYDQTFAFLKKLMLGFLDIDEAAIVPSAGFRELGVDSLDMVEVQVELQKAYGVTLTSAVFSSG